MEFAEDDSSTGSQGFSTVALFRTERDHARRQEALTALHELAHLCLSFNLSLSESEGKTLSFLGGASCYPKIVLENELGTNVPNSLFELASLKEQ
jgi:hypothetical protein